MATLTRLDVAEVPDEEVVWDVAYSRGGATLAAAGGFHAVVLYNADDLGEVRDVLGDVHHRTVRRVAWAPSGRALAAASFDATVSVWALPDDASAGGGLTLATLLQGHENEVKAAAWSASGSLLATCSRDKSVWIWNLDVDAGAPACVAVLQGHSQDVKAVAWHPTQDVLVSASYDNEIRVWLDDDDEWFCAAVLAGHASTVWDVSFSPDGSSLVSASADGSLRVWTLSAVVRGEPKGALITEASDFVCVAHLADYFTRDVFSVDWNKTTGSIVAAGADNAIVVLAPEPDAAAGAPAFTLVASHPGAHTADINAVAWHPLDATQLASGSDDGTVAVWKLPEP